MMGEVIRVSGRAPDVGEFLREAMLSQRFADVALCCPGGQKFLAHRLVLSAASPYLQEVLLAHSKSTNHCEPITVILAEVEAPELAAILGFVYTGNATVPRPRVEAFLRAAETLRIALPPIPALMSHAGDDCKQEDAKDVKISPKYLECDQYPLCEDKWCQAERLIRRRDTFGKIQSYDYPGVHLGYVDSNEIDQSKVQANIDNRPRQSPSKLNCPSTWMTPSFTAGVNHDRGVERVDRCSEEDIRRHHPASLVPSIDRTGDLSDKNILLGPSCETSSRIWRQGTTCSDTLDPLEMRLRTDYLRVRTVSFGATRLDSEEDAVERDPARMESEGTREDRLLAVRSRDNAFQGRSTSLQYGGRFRTQEKPDYGQTGEDLTCGESCCRWRTPRRQVANRVTASPWRQIVRPHHLPKIQPMVLQTHVDDTEAVDTTRLSEIPRPSVSSISPSHQLPKNTDTLYGYEVPNPYETTFTNITNSTESSGHQDPRLQDYYVSPVPFTATTQIAPTVSPVANNSRPSENFFQVPSNAQQVTTRLSTPLSANIQVPSPSKKPHFGQVSQASSKPEISHPISRLCDTVEIDEKRDNHGSEAKKVEQEVIVSGKIAERIFVNSDSNNNDAIVSNEVPSRGKIAGQEDYKCDQCGKAFVTRASLKVHTRTHSGEKPFRCADCGKQFSQLRNYKYHRSVHEGTREFAATCPECGKYFNDRGYLSSHMKIHRNRKEYGCAECGKSFNQRVAYNMHVRIHTGVKPHQCDQCGKAFSRKMLLKQHLRTHSGERPYQCQVCQKAFADRSNMTLHTRLHSGLKPYQCTLCSKAFTKKHHLKTHLNYHTGTKPYSCPNCGLRFSQSSNMRTHFKKCLVNNPEGVKASQQDVGAEVGKNQVQVVPRSPSDALTPPTSDQESSILTPISKTSTIETSAS